MIYASMSLRRFRRALTIFGSNRSDRNGIISRGRWTAREYVSLNRTLTKVSLSIFFRKSPLHAAPRFASLSLSLPLSLAFFPDRFSLFLSRLHPRARSQPRNRPAGKRECISRLLSFPSIFYQREKNRKVPSTYIMCTCLSRGLVCVRARACIVCVCVLCMYVGYIFGIRDV